MVSRALALVVALVATSASLAGCLADAPPPGAQIDVASDGLDDLTMPDNRSGTFNAFEETNVTETGAGGVDHHHDYWLGRDRVEIFGGHAMMDPSPTPGSSAEFTMGNALVFEGTASLEFTVKDPKRHACEWVYTRGTKYTCTDDNNEGLPKLPPLDDPAPPKVSLEYMHASASDWIEAGELRWGEALVLPVKPVETDMPHSTASLWKFRVVSDDALASTLTFEASAVIVRGEDVPLWPPHPDFYAERSTRVIYDGPASTREGGVAGRAFGTNTSLEQKTPGKLISYGTRSVYVWINITDHRAPSPEFAPSTWYLYFHNATGDWYAAGLRDEDTKVGQATSFAYVLQVDDAGMDSPYAPDSRWQFLLRGTKDLPNGDTCYSGCATYQVDYTMTILATDRVADEYTETTDA